MELFDKFNIYRNGLILKRLKKIPNILKETKNLLLTLVLKIFVKLL